jgi:hypothetical protein
MVFTGTAMLFVLALLATLVHKPLEMPPIGRTIFILFALPLGQEAQAWGGARWLKLPVWPDPAARSAHVRSCCDF